MCYAKMRRATTASVKISELATHHRAYLSPRILPLRPMTAAPMAARPLAKASSSASSPRVRPPTPAPKFLSLRKAAVGGPLARCHSRSSAEGDPLVKGGPLARSAALRHPIHKYPNGRGPKRERRHIPKLRPVA